MNRRFRSLGWMCAAAVLLSAGVFVLAAAAQSGGGAVLLATQADAARLDPANTGDVPSMMVQSVMFEGLVGWDKDQKLVPQLAESWTLSDGGKVITWKLRHGVKFHDGEEFDAQAAKVNFDRWLDKANGLLTLSQFATVDNVEVVDKYTLKMMLKEPNGALLQTLAGRRAMFNSPKALAKWGKDINLHPTGTGPFEFVEWVPKDRLTVKRFDGYWGTKPALEKITFKPVPEPASRVAMLEAGDADAAAPIPIQDVGRLRGNPKLNVMMVDSLDNLHFALNMQKDIFKDVRVRQALNYAVDKDSIVKNIYNGLAVPLTKSPVSPFLWGYSPVGDFYKYDPAKAKELLKAAGVKPGTKLVMWIPDGRYVQDRQVGEAVAGYLRDVGFDIQIVKMEWARGPGIVNVAIAVGVNTMPGFARIAHSTAHTVKETEHVAAALALGNSGPRILWRHILPNCLAPIVVQFTLRMGTVVVIGSGLSFLGLGAQPPSPEWGAMLSTAREYLRTAPHLSLVPGLAILLLVLGWNLLGDGLTEALNPKLSRS